MFANIENVYARMSFRPTKLLSMEKWAGEYSGGRWIQCTSTINVSCFSFFCSLTSLSLHFNVYSMYIPFFFSFAFQALPIPYTVFQLHIFVLISCQNAHWICLSSENKIWNSIISFFSRLIRMRTISIVRLIKCRMLSILPVKPSKNKRQ